MIGILPEPEGDGNEVSFSPVTMSLLPCVVLNTRAGRAILRPTSNGKSKRTTTGSSI